MEHYCPKCGYANSNISDMCCSACGYVWDRRGYDAMCKSMGMDNTNNKNGNGLSKKQQKKLKKQQKNQK